VVKECKPLRRGIQVQAIMASRNISEGSFRCKGLGAANWWRLLEKVAIIVRVDLLYIKFLTIISINAAFALLVKMTLME
jgi:hypothetical protein